VLGPRLLRVAELIQAEPPRVEAACARLPIGTSAVIAGVPAGTLLTLEYRGRWWDLRPRWVVLRGLMRALRRVDETAARTVVVAAAILRRSQVLVAQRNGPAEAAGRWEFPGGKVERGETLPAALARECAEELGCVVTVGAELRRGRSAAGAELVLLRAELADGSAEPKALEHREIRWLTKAALADLDWLPSNEPLAAALAESL